MTTPSRGDDDARDLETLRTLLVGGERDRLEDLEERLERQGVTAQGLADMLPAAVVIANERDERLGRALSAPVDAALHDSVRRDPKSIADALFPVLGPAIRKAISAALSGVVESFNRALEDSVSVTGLKWRLEAWRTKRPYHEVVLGHTLVFRVRQVFLTHRHTGIMLEHCQDPTIAVRDPDLVSVMLRAIEDFVADSFSEPGESDDADVPVREIRFDDQDVLVVAPGPYGVVAAVVDGRVTPEFELRLQETVERVHAELGSRMRRFDGDTSAFVQARPLLEACMVEERRERPRSKVRLVTAALLVVAALAALWGAWTYARTEIAYGEVRDALREAVDAADGWSLQAITRVDAVELAGLDDGAGTWRGKRVPDDEPVGGFVVRALRDPSAEAFVDVVPAGAQRGLGVAWRLTPMLSLEPWIVAERLRADWRVPDGVTVEARDGRLVLSGAAGYGWRTFAAAQPTRVGGLDVDLAGLVPRAEDELTAAASDLERLDIFCSETSGLPALGGEHHELVAAALKRLVRAAERADRLVEVVVEGRDAPAGLRFLTRAVAARAGLDDLVDSPLVRWDVARGRPLDDVDDLRCVELRVRVLDEVPPPSWLK